MTERGIRLSLLVNAAGADIQKPFEAYTQEKITFQCRANFEAAVDMCHFAVSNAQTGLEIVNISSVSGIYPMPYFAIYSATKSALTSFSIALREEVKGKGNSPWRYADEGGRQRTNQRTGALGETCRQISRVGGGVFLESRRQKQAHGNPWLF